MKQLTAGSLIGIALVVLLAIRPVRADDSLKIGFIGGLPGSGKE